MRVLSVAYPFAPVAPDTAGGAEQVLLSLDRHLVSQGHESFVIGAEGSRVQGQLVGLPPFLRPITDEIRRVVWTNVQEAISAALLAHAFDVIHFHGVDFVRYLPVTSIPVLVTLHLPLAWYSEHTLTERSGVWFHCVSESQAAGATLPHFLAPIANGVDLTELWPKQRKHGYLLALGRICKEKGFHDALYAAQQAGWPLFIAGEVFPYLAHQEYFRVEIGPQLDGRKYRCIGPVGGSRKRRLLAGAAAVLLPSTAPETSSLVVMEALASGTPVIAYNSGALPDLIQHGKTGFVVTNAKEMGDAILRLGEISPRRCRTYAEQKFDFNATASRYFETYCQIRRA